jgi:hypothetical protein
VRETSAPDHHYFIVLHGKHEELRMWGDGPRTHAGGLTPEVGIAVHPPMLQEKSVMHAIATLLQMSLRWQNIPMSDIAPALNNLVATQATVYGCGHQDG